jgi:EmrB/QacA subfamily drug resistance transporter
MRCPEANLSAGRGKVESAGHERKPLRPGLILGICCLSVLLIGMDLTIVNVAVPAIQKNFGARFQDMQWVIDGYTLVLATLLLLTGSISDRYGRKRTFQMGFVLFTLASLLCGLATDVRMLIAFRVLQGVGASMLNPVALSIVAHTFPDAKARARAIGIWGAVYGTALGLGPIVGGILTQTIGWRAIFIINLPVGIAAVALTAWFIPESKAARARAFDPVGQALMIAALGSLTYAIIEGQQLGWNSALVIGLFILSVASVTGLMTHERRLAEPLLDMRFFRSVPFSGATLIAVIVFGCFAAILFLNSLYVQQERGFSAFQAGLCTLPLAVMATLCGPLSGRMVGNYGTRPSLLITGSAMMASGLLLVCLVQDSPISLLLLAYGIFGAGLGMVNPVIATVAVSGMPQSQTGVAAAVASTSRQAGASLGIAIAGTVVHAGWAHGIDLAHSTHLLWWSMGGLGAVIILLAWAINTPWAQESSRRVAALYAID